MDKFLALGLLLLLTFMFTAIREERKDCKKQGYEYSCDYGCIKEKK